jgi:assimilatory nitrate reductase catalytic subunit
MTNLEGRLLYRRRALAPPAGVRSDLQVLKLIAVALGRGELLPDGPQATFDELRRASAGGSADYAGFSYARLARGEQLFWPCPDETHPGTPRLFLERFATHDGLARFHPVEPAAASEDIDEDYPLYLTTGRLLSHYQSGVQTRRSPTLLRAEPEPMLELHPQTAGSYGIARGDWVQVETRRGRALFKARLSTSLRFDTLFVPFHWGGASCANDLTQTTVDPLSKIPAFKLSAARIRRASTETPQ